MAAPRSIYFLAERGFYLHALGVSAELLAESKILPEKRRSKNKQSCLHAGRS